MNEWSRGDCQFGALSHGLADKFSLPRVLSVKQDELFVSGMMTDKSGFDGREIYLLQAFFVVFSDLFENCCEITRKRALTCVKIRIW